MSQKNPRYFADDTGRVVYLSGSHTWANFQDIGGADPPPPFDYAAYLDWLRAHGHNFFRLWTWEHARYMNAAKSDDVWIRPSVYRRVGPGTALDGGPKFDLNLLNDAYFDRLRARVAEAGRRGIYVSVMLFNGFSIEPQKGEVSYNNPWRSHPFNGANNVNGIDGERGGFGRLLRLFGPGHSVGGRATHQDVANPVNAFQKAYVQKVIDTVNDLDNVLYEISNESPSGSNSWQYDMIKHIRVYEARKPKQHPIGMTVAYPGGSDADVFDSPADWVSPNNNTHDYLNDPPVATGQKVLISDTDHLCGICGTSQWVWKSFTRGLNPIYMDVYNDYLPNPSSQRYDPRDPALVSLRKQLGLTVGVSQTIRLADMTPQPRLCSTGYCLAYTGPRNAEYVVYQPSSGGTIRLDLTGTTSALTVIWINLSTGVMSSGGIVQGGRSTSLVSPFDGDAVLHLKGS